MHISVSPVCVFVATCSATPVGRGRSPAFRIGSLGPTLRRTPGVGEMKHKTTMYLPQGAGGMQRGYCLSACCLT